ncbi:hypothetical protein [Actinoplanes atraurantiacus]|uniref:LPXTG-motif cell wall anchor domain-containing protein n=1 Tax=Paractinoplanes atraurantiacus TaxID=1036182 RepID=A0A285IQ60_9ACTN|nr:hypothetical protein SAMN05421748_110240 [Actinoplanes atraurantiacus]
MRRSAYRRAAATPSGRNRRLFAVGAVVTAAGAAVAFAQIGNAATNDDRPEGSGAGKVVNGQVILTDTCVDSNLTPHDGFQNGNRCVSTEFGEVGEAANNPTLLITDAPQQVAPNTPFTLKISTRNLIRDRFLAAGKGGYYVESSVLQDGLVRGHFHTACRMLENTNEAPAPEPVPAFFVATEDSRGSATPDEVSITVPGVPAEGTAQCASWAGDGSHRVPMMQRANQTPAIDAIRITVRNAAGGDNGGGDNGGGDNGGGDNGGNTGGDNGGNNGGGDNGGGNNGGDNGGGDNGGNNGGGNNGGDNGGGDNGGNNGGGNNGGDNGGNTGGDNGGNTGGGNNGGGNGTNGGGVTPTKPPTKAPTQAPPGTPADTKDDFTPDPTTPATKPTTKAPAKPATGGNTGNGNTGDSGSDDAGSGDTGGGNTGGGNTGGGNTSSGDSTEQEQAPAPETTTKAAPKPRASSSAAAAAGGTDYTYSNGEDGQFNSGNKAPVAEQVAQVQAESGNQEQGGLLALTGSNTFAAVAGAAVLLLIGMAIMAFTRRRRPGSTWE